MDRNEQGGKAKMRILMAAIECFSAEGYRGSTTRKIAQTADVHEVTIFRLFGNKKNLMLQALRMMTPGPEDVDMSKLTYGKDVKADLKSLIWNYAVLHLPHMPAYRLTLNINLVYERSVYYQTFSKIEGLISHMTRYLKKLRKMGAIAAADYQAIAEYVNALVLTKATEFLIAEDTLDAVDRFADHYAEFFAEILTAP